MKKASAVLFILLGLAGTALAQGVDVVTAPPIVFPGVDGARQFVTLEPTQVFWDDFGTGTLDITNRWTSATGGGGNATAANNQVGATTLGSGTLASGWSTILSKPTFAGRNPGYLTLQHQVNIEFPAMTGAYRAWGFMSVPGGPTLAAPLTNAVVFAIDTNGKLRAQTWGSGNLNFDVDLSTVQSGPQLCNCISQPTDNKVHKYQITFRGDNILWWMDGRLVAKVVTGAGGPDVNTLATGAMAVTGLSNITASATVTENQVTIGDTSRNSVRVCDPTLSWLCSAVNSTGEFKVLISSGGFSPAVNTENIDGWSAATLSLAVQGYNLLYNGSTWDRYRSITGAVAAGTGDAAVAIAPTSVASAGIAPVVSGSASSGVVIKATAGNLYGVYATCTAACWLMVFNSATVPGDGATTAGVASGNLQECLPITAGGSGSINYNPGPPETFTVGISAAISSTACATKTAAVTGFIHGSAQ